MNWSAKVVDTWNLAELVGSALGPVLIHCLVGPRAVLPDGALHRAALGHLDTVQGVAVGAEETGDEIVAAAELATLGVHLLPPVLVVASAGLDGEGNRLTCLPRLLAHTLIEVVKRIAVTLDISPHANQEHVCWASGPAPPVHGSCPHSGGMLIHLIATLGDRATARTVVYSSASTGSAETITPAHLINSINVVGGTTVVLAVDEATRARALAVHALVTTADTSHALASSSGEIALASACATLLCNLGRFTA